MYFHIDGLVLDCGISIALALEIPQLDTNVLEMCESCAKSLVLCIKSCFDLNIVNNSPQQDLPDADNSWFKDTILCYNLHKTSHGFLKSY